MRKIIITLVLCSTLITACSNKSHVPGDVETIPTITSTPETKLFQSPTTGQTLKISDYFTFEKDIYMKYMGTGNEYAGFETYVDYIKNNVIQIRNINGGTTSVIVYQLEDGALKKVYTRGETYHKYDYTSLINNDEIVLKEPIETGNSWPLSDGATRSITSTDMKVKTPKGEFSTIEVTTQGKDSVVKEYYAKNTGLVKREFKSADGSFLVTSELEKVDKNVPYKQKVKFFYPEFMENRVVYIEKSLETFTNEDLNIKFQQNLKTIPKSSGLTKVLSENTQILGINIDEKNNSVILNFSPHLVREMNAGTSLESMLLKSITETFGHYFQKDKVIITLEGKPYESGHILMRPGEGFSVSKDNLAEYSK